MFFGMTQPRARAIIVLAVSALGVAACRRGTNAPAVAPVWPPVPSTSPAAIAQARADSIRYPYTAADVRFMSSMIGHHAQAIEMSRLAPLRGANPAVLRLAERIINAQEDEIVTMQTWLADRLKPVPEARSTGMHAAHEHRALMPGMLTVDQMQQLDRARGAEFDRLFLTLMIQHHRGAVAMVQELFSSPGAGQDEIVFKFASDVNVDQTTEIARMELMLAELTPNQRTQP